MNCSGCGHENRAGRRFCGQCGAALEAVCPACGTPDRDGERFCGTCGAELAAGAGPAEAPNTAPPAPEPVRAPRDYTPRHLADRILRSRSALEGERKRVTVLFADVKGSMELAEQLDAETWHGVLDRFFEILTEGVHRFEGTVNQYTGDGVMALFGAPIAHEDHAHRACYAALHLRDALREFANGVRVEHGVAFGCRIGINSGEVVVGKIGDDLRMDYTAQGQTVGLAQRMETLADPGSICVSEHTAARVEGYFDLDDLGRAAIKGVSEPVGIFELRGAGRFRTRLDVSRSRGLSTFVGREPEMATLEAALESALSGEARIAGVVAEAGVGKSRLCFEFVERCRARGIWVSETHCPVHGRSIPLLPIIELLRSYFGVNEGEAARAVREKVAGRLLLLDPAFERDLPMVWDLLRVPDPERPAEALDTDAMQQRLFDFVRRLVRARSEREPAVLLLDDLHWIDPASDAIVAQLVEAIRGTRTLLLTNFRPEYRADWMTRSDYQQLPLRPLGPEAIRAMLAALLGPDQSVADVPEAVARRTAGNPFFTEEVVQGLIESRRLVGERGAYRLEGPLEGLDIPPSVHAVLAARIDRLAEREKRVLQTAAVIGLNFAYPVLERVADEPAPLLADALRALADAEFVYERALYPVAEYAFKHPLTHEVAYGSLLTERRRGIHAALARAFEADGAPAAVLAYHYDEADEPEPACRWHRAAAETAGFSDEAATIRHWQRILDLEPRLPETRERLSQGATARAQLLWMELRRGVDQEWAERTYAEACALGERADDRTALSRARIAFAIYRLYSGQPGAVSIAEQAVEDADASGNLGARLGARWVLGSTHWFSRDQAVAMALLSEGVELAGDDIDVGYDVIGFSASIFLRAMCAAVSARQGRCREALADLELLADDRGLRHAPTQAVTRATGAHVHRLSGDARAGLAWGRRALEALESLTSPPTPASRVFVNASLGLAELLAGNPDAAIASCETSLRFSREAGTFMHLQVETLVTVARARLALGDAEAALATLEEAFREAERMEVEMPKALAYLARAQVRRSLEPADLDSAAEDLDAAERLVERLHAQGLLPEIAEERAALAAARGDAAGASRALERAGGLYREMGAEASAARIELLQAAGR